MKKKRVISPCVSVCRIDADNVCEDCGRTIKEIREWSIYSDKRKVNIMKRLKT
jgi:uncharacterized protein